MMDGPENEVLGLAIYIYQITRCRNNNCPDQLTQPGLSESAYVIGDYLINREAGIAVLIGEHLQFMQ